MNYDVIGDIHGHADALKALLTSLAYQQNHGTWRHPERQALFVGDFIDRGPRQLETVDIVRRMVDAGSALAIMGNHEFNAIGWSLPDPERPGEYLRPHHSARHGDKNFQQHKAFLAEVANTPCHKDIIDWFLTLPLWLELDGIRAVHACWHSRFIDYLAPRLAVGNRLTEELMIEACEKPADEADKDTAEPSVFKAVDALVKGVEIPLPPPHGYQDKDGHQRHRVRVRWWDGEAVSNRQAALLEDEARHRLPDIPVPEHTRIGHDGGTPVLSVIIGRPTHRNCWPRRWPASTTASPRRRQTGCLPLEWRSGSESQSLSLGRGLRQIMLIENRRTRPLQIAKIRLGSEGGRRGQSQCPHKKHVLHDLKLGLWAAHAVSPAIVAHDVRILDKENLEQEIRAQSLDRTGLPGSNGDVLLPRHDDPRYRLPVARRSAAGGSPVVTNRIPVERGGKPYRPRHTTELAGPADFGRARLRRGLDAGVPAEILTGPAGKPLEIVLTHPISSIVNALGCIAER